VIEELETEAVRLDEIQPGAAAPWNRMAVAFCSLIGSLIALYLLAYKIRLLGSIACGTGGCETVQASPWADFLGIPVPAWGLGGYLTIMALALAGLEPRFVDSRPLAIALLALSTYAFGFSMYLTAIEAFRLHAWCRWCVGSAIVATLIFVFSLWEIPRIREKHFANQA